MSNTFLLCRSKNL